MFFLCNAETSARDGGNTLSATIPASVFLVQYSYSTFLALLNTA